MIDCGEIKELLGVSLQTVSHDICIFIFDLQRMTYDTGKGNPNHLRSLAVLHVAIIVIPPSHPHYTAEAGKSAL